MLCHLLLRLLGFCLCVLVPDGKRRCRSHRRFAGNRNFLVSERVYGTLSTKARNACCVFRDRETYVCRGFCEREKHVTFFENDKRMPHCSRATNACRVFSRAKKTIVRRTPVLLTVSSAHKTSSVVKLCRPVDRLSVAVTGPADACLSYFMWSTEARKKAEKRPLHCADGSPASLLFSCADAT